MKLIFLFCAFLLAFGIHAQNIVGNPDFEINTGCPGSGSPADELSLATGWHGARMEANYFNSCANSSAPGSGVPSNAQGFQAAASGNGYAGFKAYEKGELNRGFIYAALTSQPVIGRVYLVSFKASLSENSPIAISNLGAKFIQNTNDCLFNAACPYPYPQQNFTLYDTLRDDVNNWMELSFYVACDRPFQYVAIGVFDDVPFESPQAAEGAEAYYYIDDVSVVELNMVFDAIPDCRIRTAQYNETCAGASDASISADVIMMPQTPYTIQWSPQPGGGQGTTYITGLSAQTYTAIVLSSDGNCTASVTITEPGPLALDIDLLHPSCEKANGYVHVQPADTTESFTFSWNTAPPQTTGSIDHLLPGSYTVTAENEDGCTLVKTFTLANTGLVITVTPQNPEIMPGDSVQLIASGGVAYTWTPPVNLGCTDCSDPYASPMISTNYTVTGIDAEGCTGSASTRVKVWCPDIFVPTIFSPNGDGQNDHLCRMGGCFTEMIFSIYNRWGEKVFETRDTDGCWNGTYKGQAAEAGAYVYQLQGTDSEGEKILLSGNVVLIR